MSGINLPDFTIGLAIDDSIGQGLLGVGYAALESISYNTGLKSAFPTVLDALVTQGNVERYAFSLYLNDLTADSGSILFGGIDTAKYTGDLVALPIQKDVQIGITDRYLVTLTSVSFVDANGKVTLLSEPNLAASALLDSGTPTMTLPEGIANQLLTGLGAFSLDAQDILVPCSYANSNAKVRFSFGGSDGAVIDVPMSELVFKGALEAGATFDDGTPACELGIESTGANLDGSLILGDTFLRSAYIVYDLENNLIAMAPAKYTDDTHVSVIHAGTSIPGATKTASATATNRAQTGIPIAAGPSSVSTPTAVTVPSPTFVLGSATGNSPTGAAASTAGVGGSSSGGGGMSNLAPACGVMQSTGMICLSVLLGVVTLVGSFVL